MSDVTTLLIEAGIIPECALREHARWSFTPDVDDHDPDVLPMLPEQLPQALAQAAADTEYTFSRQTDLDALRQFGSAKREGTLMLRTDTGKKLQASTFFYITSLGSFRFPYESTDMIDYMTNGQNFLQYQAENGDTKQVWFSDGVYLHYGKDQAFCELKPSVQQTISKKKEA